MATPFYDLPSPDDEDERLTQEEWLATHGSMRPRPQMLPDTSLAGPRPPVAPQAFGEQEVWGALAKDSGEKLSPVPAPSEQTARGAQQQLALGNVDKAAQAFVQATKQGQAENVAAGEPNARPAPELPPITNGSVAQAQRPAAQGSHGIDLEQPPEYKAPGQGAFWVALLADAFLNKGRSMGGIVSRYAALPDEQGVNYQRRMQHAKDVADLEATRRRGTLSPEEEELRQARLEIARGNLEARKTQIGQQGEGLEMRRKKQEAEMQPGSPEAERIAEQLEANGVPRTRLRDAQGRALSIYEQKQLSPAIKNHIELGMGEQMNALAADKARGIAEATEGSKVRVAEQTAAATQPYKLELAQVGEGQKIAAEDRAAARTERYRAEDFSKWYSKEAEKDIAIARLMDDIDASGGAAPETLAERLKGSLAGWGIASPERLENWQAKQMVLELWARQQTGAAISATEEDRFAIQAGTAPGASPSQVEAAYKTMGKVVESWLRSKGAANTGASRTVIEAAGADPDRWLGPVARPSAPTARTTAPRRAPMRKPVADDEWQDVGATADDDEWEDM